MKYLFIGDIHGRIEVMNYVDEKFPDHHKVFLGDYVDSFNRTRGEQLACIQKGIEMTERGVATCIMGNHDVQYVLPRMRCGGYGANLDMMLIPLKNKILDLFPFYLYKPGEFLATHAGLTKPLVDQLNLDIDNLEEHFQEWGRLRLEDGRNPNGWVGYARWGTRPYGGILWCDFNEEFVPIEGLNQVFGHTNKRDRKYTDVPMGIRTKGFNNFNLDCLDRKIEFLEYENRLFHIISVDDVQPTEN